MTLGNPDTPEIPPRQPRPVSTEYATSGGTPKVPGWRTTEFWMALASLVAGVVLVAMGKDELGSVLIIGSAGTYAVGRGLAKR